MPSRQSELTVIVRAKELASYIMTVTEKSPKRFRFTLTSRLQNYALNGYEGETLKLSTDQIPAVGREPAEGYMTGAWDVTPDTATEIIKDTTYTYTYAQKLVYKVIEGANGKVQKGSGKGLTFKTDGDYGKFTGIKVGGKTVDKSLYESASGSTLVTLKSSYIDQLSVGKHTIEFLYTDGTCETTFEVQASATPTRTPTAAPIKIPSDGSGKATAKTGDSNSMGTWMALTVISVLGIGAALFTWKRYRKN